MRDSEGRKNTLLQSPGYSTLILSLYFPDQRFENASTQDSVIFDVFLINSAYIIFQALTYSYHDFIYDVNRSEG
jgi:hypothetical protein